MIRTQGRRSEFAWKTAWAKWAGAERIRQHETKLFLLVTLIIGAVVGLVIVGFILITENLGARMYPAGGAAWRRLVLPVLGSLVTGILLYRYFPDARGSGIPQTKAALFVRDGYISLRTLLGKFGCSSISLASGIALGREGPSVHVGAGITSVLGRGLGLSPGRVKALMPAGTSAALAAAFNTPIAAILFSLEEVMGDLQAPVLGSAVLSAATSWMVLHLLLGNEPLFHVPAYQLVHPMEFGAYAVLGVAGGLVSVCFVKLLLALRKRFLGMPGRSLWLQPVAGGLLVGLLGWFVPEVLGVGYGHVGEALNGRMALGAMALLVVLKTVATAGCYASGNAGGIFGPSLFIGAMLGGAVGSAANLLFPDYTGSVGAYALVGMGTTFAGIIRVPLTSVIMIFELTRDYSIIVPLMVSNLISFIISYRLQRKPIYEALQHQDGVHLPSAGRSREAPLPVSHAMRSPEKVLAGRVEAAEARASLGRAPEAVPVVGEQGLLGMISASQLEAASQEGRANRTLEELLPPVESSRVLTAEIFPHVHPDHPVDTALRRMAAARLNVLPVVSRANPRELCGVVSMRDVVNAYGLGEKPARAAEPAPAETRAPVTLLLGVTAALLGLFILTGLLTYFYRAERRQQAQEHFQAGNQLVELGRHEEAIERYRNALSISHDRRHRLALAWALLGAGRLNEAAIYLRELVQDDPNSGMANLGLGRVAAQEGRTRDAVTYYRRAVFGQWSAKPEENRREARFELADVLAGSGAATQASSELLAVLEEGAADAALRKRVGRLLLQYGSAKESAEVFRQLLRQHRGDVEAHAGLGEAEFVQANYAAAQRAFRNALEGNPDDKAALSRLQLCDQIVALDPTRRGLSRAERYRRSTALVETALGALERCTAAAPAEAPADDEVQRLAAAARQALARRGRPRSYDDAVEADVSMAQRLWASREQLCGAEAGADEALARVLAQLR